MYVGSAGRRLAGGSLLAAAASFQPSTRENKRSLTWFQGKMSSSLYCGPSMSPLEFKNTASAPGGFLMGDLPRTLTRT